LLSQSNFDIVIVKNTSVSKQGNYKMNNTLFLAGLVISSLVVLTACSSNEVAQKKSAFSQCVKENKGDEELCASKESVDRTGLICKNVTVTGSRLPERVCTTKAQREQQSRDSKMMVEGMQRRGQATSQQ
jgi:hypothetical protein|tara:strand:- start:79401 stop:79790 length:390 start_codon:yes stop_codon:yes gene_type:complete